MAAKMIFKKMYSYEVKEANCGQMAIDIVKKTLEK